MKLYALIPILVLFPLLLIGQDEIESGGTINDIDSKNNPTYHLADGFYVMKQVYPWNRTVYKNIVSDTLYIYLIAKTGFWIFRREIKKDSIKIYRKRRIRTDTVYAFDYQLLKTDKKYNIFPEAIASRNHILRIYHSQVVDTASEINLGLTFKLSEFTNNSLCTASNSKKDNCYIGLVIDSKLVGISTDYYKNKLDQNNKVKPKYLSFSFSNLNEMDVEKIYFDLKPNSFKTIK
ncbi:hypothetical protein FNH22_30795 [Fulvivirga sp. M361]|uniref:hypothetical protein n=1 Tax=Fulvivirga sp. M361 TaxID=2594266 RepID=UPI00117B6F17|nr:hypothetical protein [Fulvivirga sp. M361]TRX46440.1 hypothetical protein FNH22_30795 [Fulvivirga sp. M361]